MKQYDSTALKHLPEPVKAPFLSLEDKLYCEYYVKRWNDIAETLPALNTKAGEKNQQAFRDKVFEIDEKREV